MKRSLAAATLALALVAAGCDDDGTRSDTARVSVQMTDAPGDLESATVEIVDVYLQRGADDDEGDARVTLFTGSQTFDLLDLQNGVTEELADIVIPAGSYSQLRLVVGDVSITTEDGTTYSTEDNTLQCPSCAQSGLKVKLPGGSVDLEEDTQILLIDFDVAQSFGRARGSSGRWVMHPVMTATRLETTGVIEGTVALADGVTLPACGGGDVDLTHFIPTVVDGEITYSGNTSVEGDHRFPFVAPGTYTTAYVEGIDYDNDETLTFTATADVSSVTVASGGSATVNYTITGATCAPTPATD